LKTSALGVKREAGISRTVSCERGARRRAARLHAERSRARAGCRGREINLHEAARCVSQRATARYASTDRVRDAEVAADRRRCHGDRIAARNQVRHRKQFRRARAVDRHGAKSCVTGVKQQAGERQPFPVSEENIRAARCCRAKRQRSRLQAGRGRSELHTNPAVVASARCAGGERAAGRLPVPVPDVLDDHGVRAATQTLTIGTPGTIAFTLSLVQIRRLYRQHQLHCNAWRRENMHVVFTFVPSQPARARDCGCYRRCGTTPAYVALRAWARDSVARNKRHA